MFEKWKLCSIWIALSLMLAAGPVFAAEEPLPPADVPVKQAILEATGREWCQTQIVYSQRYPEQAMRLAACPTEGECDIASTRDSYIPSGGSGPLTVQLKFNIFRNDDGSSPAGSAADCAAQVEQLDSDFGPSGFNFVYTFEFIDNSQYRSFSDNEEFGMKTAYADQPDKQINIYIVNITGGYIGVGTFPWDGAALGNMGGIILDDNYFGSGEKTLTHELGHNLGLWHTHHGVSEVTECSDCWERADGSNGDFAGDFCSDTDPTPTNFNCPGPGGTDVCSGFPWGPTDTQNFMGYAPDFCYMEFSEQQWGRMHCWTTNHIASQLALGFVGTPLIGESPLDVTFTYESSIAATGYKWYFGDGDSSSAESPMHSYGPGIYDVQLLVTTAIGDLSSFETDFVTVHADTLDAPDTEAEVDVAGAWDVTAVNAVPVTEFTLPFSLTNVTGVIFFDSVSFVGTRLEYFEQKQVVFDNRFSGQLAYRLIADNGGGSPPLPPGSGLIARIHYRTRSFTTPGQTSVLTMPQLGLQTLKATTLTGDFVPQFDGGTLTIAEPPCDCSLHGELTNDTFVDAIDLNFLIDHLFFGQPAPPVDPGCVHIDRGDYNCDGSDDSVDLNLLIDHIFFGGLPACDPCACASYPGDCP